MPDNEHSREEQIARQILKGFDRHFRTFRQYCQATRHYFEQARWQAIGKATRKRIRSYEDRVNETVAGLRQRYPSLGDESILWSRVKARYLGLLIDHLQPECAETFYNSVACRVLHRDYYNNDYIFWRPGLSTEHLLGTRPIYQSYYPQQVGLRRCLLEILRDTGLENPFQNLRRDVRYIEQAIHQHRGKRWRSEGNEQLQVYSNLFFRNKAAYIVCRSINGNRITPLIFVLMQDARGRLFVDTVLRKRRDVDVLFSFSRAYFMVDMEVTSACVAFLKSIMPGKSEVDLNAIIGLQKQAKTLFYRELQHHLTHSRDNLQIAPGIRGMVMLVFTLPSFPFVFKLIKDRFDPPKTANRAEVKAKYQLVKLHDRVGRLADTLEFSNVALPLNRIEPQLLRELQAEAARTVEISGDRLILGHVYIERRMIPLDEYLQSATEKEKRRAIQDYGQAIRDLAAANIFPGDMLKKNFGVTRNHRVVFYDYDEICYLHECNFRKIPPSRYSEDEMSATPWYSVAENDVFPETFARFFCPGGKGYELFAKDHACLMEAGWWQNIQSRIEAGEIVDVFPYPRLRRFSKRFSKKN